MPTRPETLLLDPADVFEGEPEAKVRAALHEFRLCSVVDPQDPAFDEVYQVLEAEFGARGELERREVLVNRLHGPIAVQTPPLHVRYFLLEARTRDHRLAGVRDVCVSIDRQNRCCVVYLAHTLVLPPYRRTGLAALLRAVPATLARRELTALGLDPKTFEILLAGEMEPVDPRERDTVIRLLAYGRSGFVVIPPALLPYCQPDFRDLDALEATARPIPLVAVIRWVGQEHRRTLPRQLAEAYVHHIYAIYGIHCRIEDLEEAHHHALAPLRSSGLKSVPLLPLPSGPTDLAKVESLLRSAVLPLFPPSLQGLRPPPAQSPEQEMETLLQTWSTAR